MIQVSGPSLEDFKPGPRSPRESQVTRNGKPVTVFPMSRPSSFSFLDGDRWMAHILGGKNAGIDGIRISSRVGDESQEKNIR